MNETIQFIPLTRLALAFVPVCAVLIFGSAGLATSCYLVLQRPAETAGH